MIDLDEKLYAPVFRALGRAALYRPPQGPDLACMVRIDMSDRSVGTNFGELVVKGGYLTVRASEVSAPTKGGAFVIGNMLHTITEDPQQPDADRLLWSMRVSAGQPV